MNSFQAKIGWKQMRKREIKIIVPFRSFPMCNRNFQKKKTAKKFKKLKQYHYCLISGQNRLEEEAEKERK